MRVISASIALAFALLAATAAFAGSCPTRGNSLEEFRNCMVPLKGTIGTASVYSSGRYDQSHKALMSAMARGSGVPPQVMPAASVGPYPFVGYYSPYFRFANAYMYGMFGFNTPHTMNPYLFGYTRYSR
ncbi:MAG: hypothetical protein JXA24_05285 [Proteobacteria bacterium]|nr:hypothetical protein [Pseudomonadota bacterium]